MINLTPIFRSTLAFVALAGLVETSPAAIVLDDSGGFAFEGSASQHTVTSANLDGFDANGSDKLVVSITGERAGTSNNTVSGVTYGGVDLDPVVANNATARKLSIWYLDNVNVTGDIVVSYVSSQSGIGISAVALSGTLDGFADTSDDSQAITTTTSGEFVLAAGIANGGTITADAPLTQLLSSADGSTGSSTGSAGYYVVPSSGSFTPSFSGDERFVAAAFQADSNVIPAPAALPAGLALMGIMLVAQRRSA